MGGRYELEYYSSKLGRERKRFYSVTEHVYAASVPISKRVQAEEFGRQNRACVRDQSYEEGSFPYR